MYSPSAMKSLGFSLAALIAIGYFWWSGAIPLEAPPLTVGVYNVQTGKPVVGIQVVLVNDDESVQRLGFTDRKGQIDINDMRLEVLRSATIASKNYVTVQDPGKAEPAITVDVAVFVRYRR